MSSKITQNSSDVVRGIQDRIQSAVGDFRAAIGKVDEPQLNAMLETSAEVLIGLNKAFSDYEQKNEKVWRS